MRVLDFMSGAPKLAIFREGANKTTLGGALFLIYIIILLILFIIILSIFFHRKNMNLIIV